jgi:hypothetical protein
MDKYDRIGNSGVRAAIPILKSIADDGRILTVDGSDLEKDLQALGIDLVFWNNHNLKTVEVKTSKRGSEDLFIELITDVSTPRLGWLHTIKPDLFIHVSLDKGIARIFHWRQFKFWFDQNFELYRKQTVLQVDDRKTAVGVWVPWRDIAFGVTKEYFGTFFLKRPELWQQKLSDIGYQGKGSPLSETNLLINTV